MDADGVGVPGEEAERPVLEQVEQAGVDDESGGSDHAELDEFTHPGEDALGEAQGRGRGRSPVNLPPGAGRGKRGGGVRERRGFERGGSARGSLFVIHSYSLARSHRCFVDPHQLAHL